MPYEWIIAAKRMDPASGPNEPDYGDELEYEIIIGAGQEEAWDFSCQDRRGELVPAKWLNPPRKVVMAADYD